MGFNVSVRTEFAAVVSQSAKQFDQNDLFARFEQSLERGKSAYLIVSDRHCHMFAARRGEPDPSVNALGGLHCVLSGSLYASRGSLGAREAGVSSDPSVTALEQYRSHGAAGLERLEGQFSYVLWDASARALVCGRDHFGRSPLFLHQTADATFVATSPRLLARFAGIPIRLNRAQLTQYSLLKERADTTHDTAFCGIEGLSAACTAHVRPDGSRTVHQYWKPQPKGITVPRRGARAVDAYWDECRHLLFSAVEQRLPATGPVVTLLSGGLDSSAITAIARQLLERQNRELVTLSAVPEFAHPEQQSERAYMEQFAGVPNLRQIFIAAPERGPFDDLENMAAGVQSPVWSSRHFMYQAFAATAVAQGASTILDGLGGEIGPTNSANAAFPQWGLQGRWVHLLRELLAMRRVTGARLAGLARSRIAKPILKPWARQAPDLMSRILLPSFVAEYAKDQPGRRRDVLYRISQTRATLRHVTHSQNPSRNSFTDGLLGAQFVYPFLDKSLAEFAISAPADAMLKDGYARYMVRRSLDGVLPKTIQWRTTKAPFSTDYVSRYNRQRTVALEYVSDLRKDDPVADIVDVERIKQMLANDMPHDTAAAGYFDGSHVVPGALSAIAFLRQFDEL